MFTNVFFLRVPLAISQRGFQQATNYTTNDSHIFWHIYASLGLDELMQAIMLSHFEIFFCRLDISTRSAGIIR